MNSVTITIPDYTAVDSRLHAMIRWCYKNAGEEYKDWQSRFTISDGDGYDFEFTFKKNKVATMFALKFLQ